MYLKNHLLIITCGLNLGLSCTILAVKSWQSNVDNCLLRHIQDYDTEFDYIPGHEYESSVELLYHTPTGLHRL